MLYRTTHQRPCCLASSRNSVARIVSKRALVPPREQCHVGALLGSNAWHSASETRYRPSPLRAKKTDYFSDEGGLGDEADQDEFDEHDEDTLEEAEGPSNDPMADPEDIEEQQLAARRLTGSQAGTSRGLSDLGDDAYDGEGYEGEEELGEFDEAQDEDSPDLKYPEVPTRVVQLSELLDGVFAEDLADSVRDLDIPVFGIQDDSGFVMSGDIYVCMESVGVDGPVDGHHPDRVLQALQAGAAAVIAEEGNLLEGVPEAVPVLYVPDTQEFSQRLAAIFYGSPSTNLQVVAVTGTSGKTTVSWLVRGLLEEAGQLVGMVGSIEHALGEDLLTEQGNLWRPEAEDPTAARECSAPFALAPYRGRYSVEETCPNGLRLQKMLAGMADRGAQTALVECTSEALGMGHTSYLDVNVAVFTNFEEEPQHVELHGSPQEYLEAKLRLFKDLEDPGRQRAVVNLDDPASSAVLAALKDIPVITYSYDNPKADVWAKKVELTIWETELIVHTPRAQLEIISGLVGRHNVHNILAAVATGLALGAPLDVIVAGIEAVEVVPGRTEVVNAALEGDDKLPSQFSVIVDAANTPQRLSTVLKDLREANAGAGRIFTVFGCDGEVGSSQARARMGDVAHTNSDFVIVTNASPRMEDPAAIVEDIVSGFPDEVTEPYAAYVYNPFQDQNNVPLWFEPFLHSAQRHKRRHIMEDRFSAIRAAIGTAKEGDVVLLAGQGSRDYVEHWDGDEGIMRGWFDDRQEARNALSKLEYLYSLVNLQRDGLVWGEPPDNERSVVVEFD